MWVCPGVVPNKLWEWMPPKRPSRGTPSSPVVQIRTCLAAHLPSTCGVAGYWNCGDWEGQNASWPGYRVEYEVQETLLLAVRLSQKQVPNTLAQVEAVDGRKEGKRRD